MVNVPVPKSKPAPCEDPPVGVLPRTPPVTSVIEKIKSEGVAVPPSSLMTTVITFKSWFVEPPPVGPGPPPLGAVVSVGVAVGDAVGLVVGDIVGEAVGDAVGLVVGEVVGDAVGLVVGEAVAVAVGVGVGVGV